MGGNAVAQEGVELDPFVSKIESGIAVRSLPEEGGGFCGNGSIIANRRGFVRRWIERCAVIQVRCWQFETEPHKTARLAASAV